MHTTFRDNSQIDDFAFAAHRPSGRLALLFILIGVLTLSTSCTEIDQPTGEPILKGTISSYNRFNGAMLDITKEDLAKAGITLGDVISITIDGKAFDVPYYDGYYTRYGELLLVAYPSYSTVCFAASSTGLPADLIGLEGHSVTVRMKEKGGCLQVQTTMSMKYSNVRSDYPDISDAEYANARAVHAGHIASGRLHRASSPFCNDINRASYVSEYLEQEMVRTVLNLADAEENMQAYDIPPYSRSLWEGNSVILCPLTADPTAEDYNNRLIEALKKLPSYPGPYVVHCMEGKDRTGYVCALLAG